MRVFLAVLLSMLATASSAQVPFGREYVLDTRYGNLQIVGGPDTAFVFFEGLFYEQFFGDNFAIIAAAGTAETAVDWVLLERINHRDDCRTMHFLLAITPEGLTQSRQFGPCNGTPTDMQVLQGQVQVTIAGAGTAETFTFDGQALHDGPAADAPPPPQMIPVRLAQSSNVTTRFGRLWVEDRGEWEEVLVLDGTPLPLTTSERVWIRGHYEGEGRDWVIASSNHTGNMCGGYFEWYLIQLSDTGPATAPPLDACRGIGDVSIENNALVVEMSHGDLGISHETFSWDGVTLTSVLAPEPAAAPAGAGDEVTRWIGRPTWEMFQDASERARMGTIMSPDQIQELSDVMSFGATIEQRGDWVLAQSCQQHNCGFARGIWAVRVSDGAVAAVVLRGEPLQTTQAFGLATEPVVMAVIAEQDR